MIKISFAKKEDAAGIISVLQEDLVINKAKKDIAKEGFLVYPFDLKEIKKWVSAKKCIILIAKDYQKKNVVGYTLGYNLLFWKKLKARWYGGISAHKEIKSLLINN